jgi:hypothetical protein
MKKLSLLMCGKVSDAVMGNSISALQILGDIKLKLSQGKKFSVGERQYLRWALERLTEGEKDPFGLDNEGEYLWPVTEVDREIFLMQLIDYEQALAEKEGKKISVDEAISRSLPELNQNGFSQSEGTLRNQYFQYTAKWKLAEAVLEYLNDKEGRVADENAFRSIATSLSTNNKAATAAAIKSAWADYQEFVIDSRQG